MAGRGQAVMHTGVSEISRIPSRNIAEWYVTY